ncbi:glycyl-radical enzyme activating protein [Desulfobotulus sp.]|uniref:glycyl-radical enzyme activating protein n=1 Tax=Desulfobotulus sp. TaxID=1940337 RepID=UPI002A35956C|nr:glycyl-radical enzyme activating protein [Desulfobotulus sp.]MDY0164240.1 glycyl-radical enzyme activating protein [Desulfobotulus sp.]
MKTPLVFSVQHGCIHDGPGIRTTLFFKGCPLRCAWCQNPESWKPEAEIAFRSHRCIGCGQCRTVCPAGLLLPERRDARACTSCMACVRVCPSEALILVGEACSEAELLACLRPEYPNFEATGGGVTFSGGEAGLFPGFLAGLAERLKEEGIHLAMESCGMYDSRHPAMQDLMGHLDLLLFDVKIHDSALHKHWCGTASEPVRVSLKEAARAMVSGKGPWVWPRLPLVPGATDDAENLKAWALFLEGLGIRWLTLLPYHDHGISKRRWFEGMSQSPQTFRTPDTQDLRRAASLFEARGIRVYGPGEEDFQGMAFD